MTNKDWVRNIIFYNGSSPRENLELIQETYEANLSLISSFESYETGLLCRERNRLFKRYLNFVRRKV